MRRIVNNCEKCKFFIVEPEGGIFYDGRCVRYAPKVYKETRRGNASVGISDSYEYVSKWPPVKKVWFCGDFQKL